MIAMLVVLAAATGADPWAGAKAACGPEVFAQPAKKQLNYTIRQWYLEQEKKIPSRDQEWIKKGFDLAARAELAYKYRRSARLQARRMMRSPGELTLLCRRDKHKYGDANGPSFEWLVEQAKKSLQTSDMDAVYLSVLHSSQESNKLANAAAWLLHFKEWIGNGFSDEVKQ
jgi:hypothetical protein